MMNQAVNVTELSRGLPEFLNQVQYKGFVLNIERDMSVVARVLSAGQLDRFSHE